MLKSFFLVFIFLILTTGLLSQNPVNTDTLTKKSEAPRPDTLVKATTVPAGQQQQVQQQKQAQKKTVRKDTRPLKDRIDIDLNTSFWINPSQVSGEISLLVSYRFPKILSIGTGPTYIFNYQRATEKNLNGLGGKVFVKAQLLKFFYLWTEYQGIDNQYISDWNPVTLSSGYVDSWFIGAGVNIRLGKRSGINMSVLYDLLHGSDSPYSSATTYRLGFSF